MVTENKQKITEGRNFELEPAIGGKKRKLPLIFYPVLVLFGIYLLWELSTRIFTSP